MKTKKKRRIKFLLTAFGACLLSTFLPGAYAAESVAQPEEISITEFRTYQFSPAQFGYWYKNSNWRKDSDTELIHRSGSASLGASNTHDGAFFVQFAIPENRVQASKNGAISVSASAEVHSEKGSWITFDKAEDITMALECGSVSGLGYDDFSAAGNAAQDTKNCESYQSVSAALPNGFEDTGFRLRFYTTEKHGSGGASGQNVMYVRNVALTVSNADRDAPEIGSILPDSTGFVNRDRTLFVSVTDAFAGVDYLLVNGERVEGTKSADAKSATFLVNLPENGIYRMQAVDNVGNRSEVREYAENMIDKVAPAAPEVHISEGWFHTNKVAFDLAFAAGTDPQASAEKIVYSLDGAPDWNSAELENGGNVLTLENGSHDLKIAAVDEAGNRSEVQSFAVNVDTNEYRVISSCSPAVGGSVRTRETVMRGDPLGIEFEVAQGYEFYKLYVSGNEVSPEGNAFVAETTGDMIVELKVRQTLTAVLDQSEYTYCGTEILPFLTANLPYEDLTVSAFRKNEDGSETECNILDAGEYRLCLSVDSEQAHGAFEFFLRVNKLKLEVEATGERAIYDGLAHKPEVRNPNPALNYRITLAGAPEEGAVHAGKYAYEIRIESDNVEGSLEGIFEIEKRKVTLTADSPVTVYGEPLVGAGVRAEGALESEPLDFSAQCALFEADAPKIPSAGRYAVTIERRNLEDYEIVYRDGTYTVARRKIRVTADEGQGKSYGEADPESLTGRVLDLVSETGEIPAGLSPLRITFVREAGEAAGEYPILIAENTDDYPDYEIEYLGANFLIEGRKLAILAKNVVTEYGTQKPLEYVIVSGDRDVRLEGALTREAGDGVGRYEILLGTLSNPLYEITFFGATYEIVPKALAVRAQAAEKIYGEADPEFSYLCEGLIEGDTLEGALSRQAGDGVGSYKITLGSLRNANYEISFVSANCVVLPRPLHVRADALGKTYGEGDPVLTYSCEGLVEGDALAGALSRQAGEQKGSYEISRGTLANDNYEIEFSGAAFEIYARPVTVTLTGQGKAFGEADGEISGCVEGLPEGARVEWILCREAGEEPGSYAVYAEGAPANYEVRVFGEYVIRKACVALSPEDARVVYDGNAVCSIPCGLPAEVGVVFTFRNQRTGEVSDRATDAGVYTVTMEFEGDGRYEAAESARATLTIRPRSVFFTLTQDTFMADGNEKFPIYQCSEPDVNVTVSFENGEAPVAAGTYAFTVSTDDPNYEGEYRGVLTVLAVPEFDESESSVQFVSGAPADALPEVSISTESQLLREDNTVLEQSEEQRNVLARISLEGIADRESVYRVRVAVKNLPEAEKLQLYAIDETGGVRKIAAAVTEGFIEFETTGACTRFVLTTDRSSNWGTWAIAGGGSLAAVAAAVLLVFKFKTKAV